jgi:hypothetical protein
MVNDFNGLGMNLGNLARLSNAESRSISTENFTSETGKGVSCHLWMLPHQLINTLLHVRRIFKKPIIPMVSGTHLMNADG